MKVYVRSDFSLKMEAARSSETLVSYRSTTLQSHFRSRPTREDLWVTTIKNNLSLQYSFRNSRKFKSEHAHAHTHT